VAPNHRKGHEVEMKMDNVELVRVLGYSLDEKEVLGEG
jgi:hypothetical protein